MKVIQLLFMTYGIILFPTLLLALICDYLLWRKKNIRSLKCTKVAFKWSTTITFPLLFFILAFVLGDPLWPDQDMTPEQAKVYEMKHLIGNIFCLAALGAIFAGIFIQVKKVLHCYKLHYLV